MRGALGSVDLSLLSPPDIVETLDYEAIVADMRDDLVARHPAIEAVIDLESEPARKLIEAFAYRELLLRGRINDAARSVLLSSATGNDLDQLAAFFATERMQVEDADGEFVLESDSRLRRRVRLAAEAMSVAGPEGAYVYHALSAAPWARDATAINDSPGNVRVTVMREGVDLVPSSAELAVVRDALNSDDVRPLTDTLAVRPPSVQETSIVARLTLFPGPAAAVVEERARALLAAWLEENRQLGRNLRRSAIFSKLHLDVVHSVELDSPAADVVIGPTELVSVTGIDLSISLERDQ